jgi:hypothetical protein
MEQEGSSPRSQEPATGPYPREDQSSPHSQILFFMIHFKIILPLTKGTLLAGYLQ